MGLDAIIISDFFVESLSGSNPLRLNLDNRTADIQVILNYIENNGKVVNPIQHDNKKSWASAPRLNGIYLLDFLTKQNFDVALINNYYDEKYLFNNLLKQSPKAIIISTTFIYSKKDLEKLVNDIRNIAPDVFIIVGGQFVYKSYQILRRSKEPIYNTEEIKQNFLFFNQNDPDVDLYIISLQGEALLSRALSLIESNSPIDNLPNTARHIKNEYIFSKRVDDIKGQPTNMINWSELPDSIFKTQVIPMQASIGCPYHCSFCSFTKDQRLIVKKPLTQLIEELYAISERGTNYVWFVDDNFRLGGDDLNSVFQRFTEESFKIEWMSFFRADALANVDFNLLRKSGCREVRLGLESADLNILKNMNKKASPKTYKKVVRNLLKVGINCSCYFIFGFPGETNESASRTIDFIKEIEYPELKGTLSWSIYPFMLVPLSPIYEVDLRSKFGLDGYLVDWKHNTMDSIQAKKNVQKAFNKLENSGPIYRGDNFDLLNNLTTDKRKSFLKARHETSKLKIQNKISKSEIISKFKNILVE